MPRAIVDACQHLSCSIKVVLLASSAVLLVHVAVWKERMDYARGRELRKKRSVV